MKAIKVMATTDVSGQIILDTPLEIEKNSRVEVIVLIPEAKIDGDETPKEEIVEDFRQAWHEAMTGKTIPVSQIWEGIEDV
ncbi:MAG: hypothetical protein HC836_07515 [Richelia sp. RM2_1_2]|nr:hypothetical protein [Richelia sp. SM2_1_7]NJM23087.1 hypothetical protein [Richelia sp. SM1_7_0]NJN12034.1 hypothetical protein [Richelia sp. RM1_1_1]NJO30473.1 hypothetical protein [Richelia sp. SL_2_1]NJO58204.1 hypothetical protein [Richelia sp. RM2_1_2]